MQARMMRRSMRVLIHSDVQQMVLSKQLLQSLKPPALMLWGDKERVVPPNHLTYFQKYLPAGSRFVKVRHMGHSEMAMGPKRMMRPLFKFVAHLPH
jgi:pimeloyl-ACP methyl ester carboxylesterase